MRAGDKVTCLVSCPCGCRMERGKACTIKKIGPTFITIEGLGRDGNGMLFSQEEFAKSFRLERASIKRNLPTWF